MRQTGCPEYSFGYSIPCSFMSYLYIQTYNVQQIKYNTAQVKYSIQSPGTMDVIFHSDIIVKGTYNVISMTENVCVRMHCSVEDLLLQGVYYFLFVFS